MAEETRLTTRSDLPTQDAAQLRAEIEHSRAAVSDTLNQIQERLKPARLKAQAKEKVRDATIGRVKQMARKVGDRAGNTGRNIIDVAKENPVPLALIGIGAGLLLFNSRRRGREIKVERTVDENRLAYSADGRTAAESEGVIERVGDVAHDVSEKVGDAEHAVKAAATDTAHRVGDAARTIEHKVTDAAGSVAHRVGDAARDVAGNTRRQALKAKYQYQESPWMGAAVAVALGAAAGLALPSTDPERRLMGEKRDQLLDRVTELGREKLTAARNVVSEVAADARESIRDSVETHAREEGLIDDGN